MNEEQVNKATTLISTLMEEISNSIVISDTYKHQIFSDIEGAAYTYMDEFEQ